MADQQKQQAMMDFSRNRDQLISISTQKQQYQLQSATLEKSIEELEKTSEKKVYKAVGSILILSDVGQVKKDIAEQKETIDLRVKTLQKQEDALVQKLNKLKSEIEDSDSASKSDSKPEGKSKKS